MTELATQNKFERAEDGVFASSVSHEFAYTDGAESERKLHQILNSTADLSSDSEELEGQIDDWPSEYHLSRKRSNLLRPLNLEGVERVLELGCGCGAISRYLGEQSGLQIDSVEGSRVRAGLAASRCRDLDNVRVHCANFNDLAIPTNHYDMVLLVGVTEYAGRFSERETDQQALQDMLTMAQAALRPNGVVVIAIENRLGLKYLLGACEDHYGRPWLGVDNYPQSEGIRTYSKPEWEQQIRTAGFAASRFCYPFPDYKIPTLVLDEAAISSENSLEALSRIKSRDYLQVFEIKEESRVWSGLVQAEIADQSANSFLIVLGQSHDAVERLATFGVAEYQGQDFNWHEPEIDANTRRLQNKLGAVTEQRDQLGAEIQLYKSSKALKLLQGIRRLFGGGVSKD